MPVAAGPAQEHAMPPTCPMFPGIHYISRKWMLPLMLELFSAKRPLRFADLLRTLAPITPKLLSLRLKELREEHYITRTVSKTGKGETVQYSATEKSKSLSRVLHALRQWCRNVHPKSGMCENCRLNKKCRIAF